MKRSELLFNLISIPVDAIALFAAGIASFYIRTNSVFYDKPVEFFLPLGQFVKVLAMIVPVLILIYAVTGLYNLTGTRKFIYEFNRVVVGTSLGLLAAVILFFFDQTVFPSRFIILATWGLSILLILLGRFILKNIQEFLSRRGFGLHRLVLISGNGIEADLISEFLKDKSYGFETVAEINSANSGVDSILEQLGQLFINGKVDEIMQTDPHFKDQDNLRLVEFARNNGLQFSFVPNLFEVQRNAIELHNIRGVPIISLKNTPLDGWGKVAKRLMDIIASLICLFITAPLFLIISIAIRVDSKGRVIYSAPRGGRNRDFDFYKFRSMYVHLSVGAEYGGNEAEEVRKQLWKQSARGGEGGAFLKIKDDPRVTKVGKFLRRTKLDEIPQFWNVLKGDMSMVGPRAHVLDEVERYRSHYRRMFSIKPGIFGLSQMAQLTWPDLPFEEEIRLNTYYIENWSLWWDIKILAKTFYMLLFAPKPQDDY